MRTIVQKMSLLGGLLIGMGALLSENASAVTVLPDPGDTFDGIPVAIQYDDFFSYSAKLLTLWGFSGFNEPAGTGHLDVLLLTGSGVDNTPVSGGFNFEAPMDAPTGDPNPTFDGLWGAGVQVDGPVTVDNVLAYLQNRFGPDVSIPIFTFDMNEPGDPGHEGVRDLQISMKMSVFDPVSSSEIAFWAFDNVTDSVYDETAYVLSRGVLEVTSPIPPHTVYTVNNNKGSGKVDFIVFSPTMDLSLYDGLGYQFRVEGHMIDLQNGFEEAYLSGAFAPPGTPRPPVIPEPGTLSLLGFGLVGASLRRRRRACSA